MVYIYNYNKSQSQIILKLNCHVYAKSILQFFTKRYQNNNQQSQYCFFLNSQDQMAEQLSNKQFFQQLREKYPEKIVQLSMKAQLLMNWIRKIHFKQFQEIYILVISLNQQRNQKKVLDESANKQLTQEDKKQIVKQLLQAVKIVVQSVQVDEQKKLNYSIEDVQKMVSDIKKTFKELSQTAQKEIINTKQKPKNISVLRSNDSLLSKNNMLNAPQKEKPRPQNQIFVRKNSGIIDDIKIGQNLFGANQQKNQTNSERKSSRSKSSNKHDSDIGNQDNDPQDGNNFQNNQDAHQAFQRENDNQKQQEQSKKTQTEHQQKSNQIQVQNIYHSPLELPRINKNMPQHKYMPYLSNSNPTKPKSKLQTIRTNIFVKKTFSHICKQSYIGGGTTFDQISQSSDVMSLNKWMVYCKQFNYVEKFKKKQLVDIYHEVTNFTNKMYLEQFLNAIILLQNKLKVDELDFLNSMGMDSQFSFRQKIGQFKVKYSGPQHNFFQQATKLPVDRYYQKIKQQKFKKDREKQKQYILHQGKFREQIIAQLSERKQFRENNQNKSRVTSQNNIQKDSQQLNEVISPYLKFIQNRNSKKNNPNNLSKLSDIQNPQNIQSPSKPQRRIQPITYSNIFHNKSSSGNTTRAFSQTKKLSSDSSIIQNAIMKNSPQSNKKLINLQKIAQIAKMSRIKNSQPNFSQPRMQRQKQYQSTKLNSGNLSSRPQRQWLVQKDWSQEYKSDSEQSDEILKQHLNNQNKRISNKAKEALIPNKINVSRMMEQYRKQEEQDDDFDRQTEGGEDNMITKVERFR